MATSRDRTGLSLGGAVGRRIVTGLGAVLVAGTVAAKPGTPGPAWFEGLFERVGRSGGTNAQLLNDHVRVVADGQALSFQSCDGQQLAQMGFGPAFEIENLLSGRTGAGSDIDCLFNPDGFGRPLLTCQAADGAAFTLFSLPAGTEGCAG